MLEQSSPTKHRIYLPQIIIGGVQIAPYEQIYDQKIEGLEAWERRILAALQANRDAQSQMFGDEDFE